MAKSKKKTGTREQAVAVAAMKRATSNIESEHDLPELTPGSYESEITVSLQGNVIVGEPTGGGFRPRVDPKELFGAVVYLCREWYADFDLETVLDSAVELLAAGDADVAKTLKESLEVATECATARKFRKKTPKRKGAVTGRPYVRIAGTADSLDIVFEMTEGES